MNCELILKRCLIGLQKGVNKGSKGHLLEAKRAWIESQFMLFLFLSFDFYLQNGGGEREEVEYDIRQRKKNQRYYLNSFNSISLLNFTSIPP